MSGPVGRQLTLSWSINFISHIFHLFVMLSMKLLSKFLTFKYLRLPLHFYNYFLLSKCEAQNITSLICPVPVLQLPSLATILIIIIFVINFALLLIYCMSSEFLNFNFFSI